MAIHQVEDVERARRKNVHHFEFQLQNIVVLMYDNSSIVEDDSRKVVYDEVVFVLCYTKREW